MASLADLLDPDQWIMSGKNLLDFPWPEGNNEREAVKLIVSTRPPLNQRVQGSSPCAPTTRIFSSFNANALAPGWEKCGTWVGERFV
jgi:hypothetical protein